MFRFYDFKTTLFLPSTLKNLKDVFCTVYLWDTFFLRCVTITYEKEKQSHMNLYMIIEKVLFVQPASESPLMVSDRAVYLAKNS